MAEDTEENFNTDEFDDSTLSEGSKAALKKMAEEGGISGTGPGSVADYQSMDSGPLLALADVAAGNPWQSAQPEGLSRLEWRQYLLDHGLKVAE